MAIPRPWNAGSTIQPVSWMITPSSSFSQIPIVPTAGPAGSGTIVKYHASSTRRVCTSASRARSIGPPSSRITTGSVSSASTSAKSESW